MTLRSIQSVMTFARVWWIMTFFLGTLDFISAGLNFIRDRELSTRMILALVSWPSCCLLLICIAKKDLKNSGSSPLSDSILNGDYMNGSGEGFSQEHHMMMDSNLKVTPFAKVEIFSKMTFWWMNPLLSKGWKRPLEEDDLPCLSANDHAENNYAFLTEGLHRQKQQNSSDTASVLWALAFCQWKNLARIGFFTLMKTLTLSAGPLVLNAFIGRRIGLQIRSSLISAIYEKLLRLSSESKQVHAVGEVMNYMAVDAYRIGEFPFWFHQIWTTPLQLVVALGILFHAVGLATFSASAVIILTMMVNSPLAKLQHKFQTELRSSQGEQLRATSEALIHMKTSPILVSTTTFVTCYLLGIPLNPRNVFTFIATLRMVQDPIRVIPDLIIVIVQARVSLSRIVDFLEAAELQDGAVEWDFFTKSEHSILITSASLSWDSSSTKKTLRNINVEVKRGQKLVVYGEVGSGKSTLLAAILEEVPKLRAASLCHYCICFSDCMDLEWNSTRQHFIGHPMDKPRYQEAIQNSSLERDLENLPYGEFTEIGERGINLSGDGEIHQTGQYQELLVLSEEFQELVNAHKDSILGNTWMAAKVSLDLSILDVDLPFDFIFTISSSLNAYSNLGVIAIVSCQVLFAALSMIYLTFRLQVEDQFMKKNLDLLDKNASPFFHSLAVNEWLIYRLELLSAIVLSSSAIAMVVLPSCTFNPDMEFCWDGHILCEAPTVIEDSRPPTEWPSYGEVKLQNLKGITCTFKGGLKIGIVARTGSGKTTLISVIFCLVEPAGGRILIDGLDITTSGLHDLRSRLGIIPQEPTLFRGTVRFNLV
eukprot:Gb_20972 [translate_table: standard]